MELIRKEQPDILISDVKMPVMDGIQLVAKVKEEFPEVLSVIVSGYSEFEYAKGALQSGVCDYLLKPLAPSDMKKLMDKLMLYRKLDESVVTGQNQMYCLEEKNSETSEKDHAGESDKQLELIEYLIRYKENGKIFEELKTLFSIFEKQKESQIYVEASIRYIFQLMRNINPLETDFVDLEFMIDDAFYYASTMQELMESVLNIVKQCMPEMAKERIDDKEQLLHSICSYIEEHMGNPITLGSICKQFGVSQTSLSRMFRTYKNSSFSNYLTKVRIEKAKQMMLTDPNAYIKDIAERVGYADQFYFSRIFRSVTGICPKEYIESAM